MSTIEQRKSLRVGQAIGKPWEGRSHEGKFWIFEPPAIDGTPGMHVKPDGNTQLTAWWFDTRDEVDAAVKLYDQKHRSVDWHEKLVDLVADCIRDQRNGFDVLASSSWDRVVEHWGNDASSE